MGLGQLMWELTGLRQVCVWGQLMGVSIGPGQQCGDQGYALGVPTGLREAVPPPLTAPPRPSPHQRLQELVVPLLLRLPQTEVPPGSPAAAAGPPGTPYASPPCRAALYQLLLALVLAPAPAGAPPLHCALRAFGQGQRDPALQVRRAADPPVLAWDLQGTPQAPPSQSWDA